MVGFWHRLIKHSFTVKNGDSLCYLIFVFQYNRQLFIKIDRNDLKMYNMIKTILQYNVIIFYIRLKEFINSMYYVVCPTRDCKC